MSTERDEVLRRAESLLRQGQLEGAIGEYAKLVDASPTDLVLLNTLGDLYVRTGTSEKATPLYARVGDAHMAEGFYARAAGYYKKILKYAPGDEGVVLKLAEASARQGLRADARRYYQSVANARHRRRDTAGLIPVLERLDDLDPADLATRLASVRALVSLQRSAALPRVVRLATALEDNDRQEDALTLWREARTLDATAPGPALRLARAAMAEGNTLEVVELLERLAIDEAELATLLARAYHATGDVEAAERTVQAFASRGPEERRAMGPVSERLGLRWSAGGSIAGQHPVAHAAAEPVPMEESLAPPPRLTLVEPASEVAVDILEVLPLEDELEPSPEFLRLPAVVDVEPLSEEDLDVLRAPTADAGVSGSVRRPESLVEIEVDLTERLNAVAREAAPPAAAQPPAPVPAGLDEAFAALRDQVVEHAEDLLGLGRTYQSAGLHDQAVEAFALAAKEPAQAYEAAVALVELLDARGDQAGAIPWLERAAETAPTPARRGAVLYRLGVALERLGERSRALRVLKELSSMAPGFRDVSARVARLEAAERGGGSSAR